MKKTEERNIEGELANRVLNTPNQGSQSPHSEREIDFGSLGGTWFTGDNKTPVSVAQYGQAVPSLYV